jgi:hypothetical protein
MGVWRRKMRSHCWKNPKKIDTPEFWEQIGEQGLVCSKSNTNGRVFAISTPSKRQAFSTIRQGLQLGKFFTMLCAKPAFISP